LNGKDDDKPVDLEVLCFWRNSDGRIWRMTFMFFLFLCDSDVR
jgi:hypothetical protein